MKKLICLIVVYFAMSGFVVATEKNVEITPELSAVLLSPEFSDVTQELKNEAEQNGMILQLSEFYSLNLGEKNYVYIAIKERISAEFNVQFQLKGELVAEIEYDLGGGIIINGIYFKPAATPPPAGGLSN